MIFTQKLLGAILVAGTVFGQAPYPAGNNRRVTRIESGTEVVVRTNEFIDNDRGGDRVYTGTVNKGVRGGNGRVAIPRGTQVELVVRTARDNDLILDLESIWVAGQRYSIDAERERIEAGNRDGIGANRRTAGFMGGGALLGTVIGAIAGGKRGAAIGAAAGVAAGAGTQVVTRGRHVRVPAESIVTFRIDQPLVVINRRVNDRRR